MEDPNKYVGSLFIWDKQKVKEIMQDIVNFTRKSDNNIKMEITMTQEEKGESL